MSTVSSEQQIIEIIEMLIPFKCNFTSTKGLKNKLENIDLERLLGELKQPSTEPPRGSAPIETNLPHEKVVEIKRYMKAAPLDMARKDLRLSAANFLAWTEVLGRITSWDSPAAVAIRNYLDAILNYQQCILAEPAEYAKKPAYARDDMGAPPEYVENNYPLYRTWQVVVDTVPGENKSEVLERTIELCRVGNPTTKRER